ALLRPGRRFAPGFTGKFIPQKAPQTGATLGVYLDGEHPLRPATRYTVRVRARSRSGAVLPAKAGTWQFTTQAPPATPRLRFSLPADAPVARWHGGFFTGFCGVSFGTNHTYRIPTFELMDRVRHAAPRAWSLQRDFWLTGMQH